MGENRMDKHTKKIFVLILACCGLLWIPSTAQERLSVGSATADPGEKQSGTIHVPAGKDGAAVELPVSVINGRKPGPTLALIAGVHGYEYPPILALQRIKRQLDPEDLSGAVIILHVANPPSFMKRTIYYNPHDWKNLNRVFPGREDGSMTERIAFHITREIIDRCDYLIDNHCGDGNEDLMPYLYCEETGDHVLDIRIRDMAVHYGIKTIIRETDRPKDKQASIYCANTAILRGKPALTIESGKLGRSDEEDIIRIVTGSLNIMRFLKMLPGRPEIPAEPVWVEKLTILRASHSGLFTSLVHRGRHVQKGELLGYLTDYFGDIIEKVHAPYDGIVLYVIATPPMNEGEPMVSVGGF